LTTVSSLYVRILGDASGLQRTLAQSATSVKGFGTSVQASTGTATKGISTMTASLVGVAVAAKAASDFTAFQTTMVRTQTLAGATATEMHKASDEILNVSTSLGKGPQELADALYFTESAGIDASHAMDVVTVSAKASAVGLGDTATVADALTSVMNAYGEENIDAAQAADILTAAVREGKGEADAIAGAIGRVIPVASEMGVSFDQVAGGIAALTQTGLDANEAVTSLRGILVGMLDPTDQAKEALRGVGLTVQDLQTSIAQQGLLPTLQLLEDRFHGNRQALAQVFGNVRALTGAMSLLGKNGDDVRGVFERVSDSAGTVDEAFALVQETAEFKLQQALAAVQTALIEVGGAIAPIVTGMADLLQILGPVLPQLALLAGALLALKIATSVKTWFVDLAAQTAILGETSATAAAQMTLFETAQAGAGSAASLFGRIIQRVFNSGFATGGARLLEFAVLMDGAVAGFHEGAAALEGIKAALKGDWETVADKATTAIDTVAQASKGLAGIPLRFLSGGQAPSFGPSKEQLENAQAGFDAINDALKAGQISASDAKDRFRELADEMGIHLTDAFYANVDALYAMDVGISHVSPAMTDLRDKQREAAAAARELAAAQQLAAKRSDFLAANRGQIADLANLTGSTAAELVSGIKEATDEGPAAVHAFVRETLGALHEWRDEAAAQLTGLGDVFSGLAQDSHLTAADVSTAFTDAAADTKSFAADLKTIAETGGENGEELARQLLAIGPSMATTADVIAGSGAEMRDKLVGQFGDILKSGQDGAKGLQTALVGPIKDIRDLLLSIARHFDPSIELKDHGTKDKIDGMQEGLEGLADNYDPSVNLHDHGTPGKIASMQEGLEGLADDYNPSVKVDDHGSKKQVDDLHAALRGLTAQTYTAAVIIKTTRENIVHAGGLIFHDGGDVSEAVPRFHSGDLAPDEVPAILQKGEYVIQRSAVQKLGPSFLDRLNRLHEGGPVAEMGTALVPALDTALAAIFRRATAQPDTTASRGILALVEHSQDVISLLGAMDTSIREFARHAKDALTPDHFKAFIRELHQAIQQDDWRSFADQIREAVGPDVWRKLADDARQAFESGRLGEITGVIRDALRTDQWQEFARTVRQDAVSALKTFHDQAVTSLDFTANALADLESTASSAMESLKSGTDLTGRALWDLHDAARLTGTEILHALERSARQTRAFARDLLEISHIGGQAAKDLAAQLLASGNILAAAAIADAPEGLQKAIVKAFGEAENATDRFADKLTHSIVGALQDIEKILRSIARQWRIHLNIDTTRTGSHHSGGAVMHSGGLAPDETLAVLQRGEYVIQRRAAQQIGPATLDALNRLHEGGYVQAMRQIEALTPKAQEHAPVRVTVNVAQPKPDVRVSVRADRRILERDLDYATLTDGYFD